MSAYKDKKTGKWYTQFSYKNLQGETKHTCKRGFETKKEALQWEQDFLNRMRESTDMLFKDFVEVYLDSLEVRIKERTMLTKKDIIRTHLIPYFGEMRISDITTKDVMKWQTKEMKAINKRNGKPYTKSYLKTVHNQLRAILNHAVKYYNLSKNPASLVGNMGNEKDIKMSFWTLDQYRKFAEVAKKDPVYYVCYEILYWCGLRKGELFALTAEDIDFETKRINIDKTFSRIGKRDILTDPKTHMSKRKVLMPDFLVDELRDYIDRQYDLDPKGRLFPITDAALRTKKDKFAEEAGLPHIRIHDFRHSHVSLLIDLGYGAVAIGERVGHASVDITYRYAHLFPDVQGSMANKLNEIKETKDNE